jgi:hypothetical protein
MSAQPYTAARFVRKTQLGQGEYRKNFHQIDDEVMAMVTSKEADQVTPLMSKVYLRLVRAPTQYWEREGVLRFEAEFREEGKPVKAWTALCELLGVASATASKALSWMHEVGVIGYFAGKNGVGIRIFLNRAASSIGTRQASGGKKILVFPPASPVERRASPNEAAFNDTYGVSENLDSGLNRSAPKNGADTKPVDKKSSDLVPAKDSQQLGIREGREIELAQADRTVPVGEIVRQVVAELEPSMQSAARQAAAREQERTREWLETRGLPKAARVAQREAYNVLRSHGLIDPSAQRSRRDAEVGQAQPDGVEAKPLSAEEVKLMAEACVALWEAQGQAIDVTLAELSSEVGGSLLPEDAPKVREAAHLIISSTAKEA